MYSLTLLPSENQNMVVGPTQAHNGPSEFLPHQLVFLSLSMTFLGASSTQVQTPVVEQVEVP